MADYAVRTDVEAIYGKDNVEKWADLNNNAVSGEITARINTGLIRGTSDIDSRLKVGRYIVPFDKDGAPIPEPIVYMCALYTGFWLYSSRGVTDYDSNGNVQDQLHHQRNEYDGLIRMILGGAYTLISGVTTVVDHPAVILQ